MKNKDSKNVYEAKESLKHHIIKFLEALKSHLNGTDEQIKARAMWATWCIHRYMNDGLMKDIEHAMRTHGTAQNDDSVQ